MEKLTGKEEEVMEIIWGIEPCAPKDVQEHYADPQPHVNTIATMFQSLERKGFLQHEPHGRGYLYMSVVAKDDYRRGKMSRLVDRYFGKSYLNVVSSFVQEERLSEDDLLRLLQELRSEKMERK